MINRLILSLISAMCFLSPLNAILTVAVIGDSISYPHPVTYEQGWPSLVSNKYGWDLHNYSIGGSTTETLMERLVRAIEETDPDMVIITLGINDGCVGLPMQTVYMNIAKAIHYAHKQHIMVLVGTVDIQAFGWNGEKYAENFQQLYQLLHMSYKHQAKFFPFMTWNMETDKTFWSGSDPVHPNALGHELIAYEIGKLEYLWVRE